MIEGSFHLEIPHDNLVGEKADEAAFEGDPYIESLAEQEKEMEEDEELVDELMAKYAHLAPE